MGSIKVGDKVPDVELCFDYPPKKINVAEYTKDKRVVIVGLPGKFDGMFRSLKMVFSQCWLNLLLLQVPSHQPEANFWFRGIWKKKTI